MSLRLWVPTITILRYRLKGSVEVLEIVLDSITIAATPTAWNAEGAPIAWRVVFFINGWQELPIHEMADFHEFVVQEVRQ